MIIRGMTSLLVIVLTVIAMPLASLAQSLPWPTKTVRIVTGWPTGGNVDVIARMLAEDIGLVFA